MVMRTTITLEPDVSAKIKRMQKRSGAKPKQLLNQVLRAGLEAMNKPEKTRKSFKIVPVDVGELLIPGVHSLAELLEIAEGPAFK